MVVARDTRRLTELQRLAALAGTRASAAHARFSAASGLAGDAAGDYRPAFTFISPTTPARWHQADSGAPVYVDTQTGGHPQFAGGGLTQLVRAAAMWGGAGSLSLPPGVARTARCFTNTEPSDGRISVTYGDPCGEISDGSSTLAIGGAYYSNSDVRTVSGISFWKITKGMIVTDNPPNKFATMSTGCYEEMLAHELGHAIGFGHAAARPAVMYPAISNDCFGRSTSLPLQADDLAGMATIYPGTPAAGPPGVPGGLSSAVSGIHRHDCLDRADGRQRAARLPAAGRQRAGARKLRGDPHWRHVARGARCAQRRVLRARRRVERGRQQRADGGSRHHGRSGRAGCAAGPERRRRPGRHGRDHVAAAGLGRRAVELRRGRRIRIRRHDLPDSRQRHDAGRCRRSRRRLLRPRRRAERRRHQPGIERSPCSSCRSCSGLRPSPRISCSAQTFRDRSRRLPYASGVARGLHTSGSAHATRKLPKVAPLSRCPYR